LNYGSKKAAKLIKENDNGNEAMYWGNVLEEVVAKEFTAEPVKKLDEKSDAAA
jgi:predicted phage-related endonuclease